MGELGFNNLRVMEKALVCHPLRSGISVHQRNLMLLLPLLPPRAFRKSFDVNEMVGRGGGDRMSESDWIV